MKGFKTIVMIGFLSILTFSCITFGESVVDIGYYDDYPLMFKDINNEPAGFLIDLIKDFSVNTDYSVHLSYDYWSENLEKLDNGRIDGLLDIVYSDERADIYDFSKEPLILNWGKMAVVSQRKVESILDLEGLRIGYLVNDYYFTSKEGIQNQVENFQLDVTFVTYKSYSEMIKGMNVGEIEAAVMNRFSIDKIYDYENIKEAPINFAASNLLMASKAGKNRPLLKAFDTHIRALKNDENSYYYERYNYWINQVKREPFEIFYESNKSYIVLAIFLLFVTVVFSRYKVTEKVKEIEATNKNLEGINSEIENDNQLIETLTEEMDQAYIDSEKTILKFQRIISFLANAMSIHKIDEKSEFLETLFNESYKLIPDLSYGCILFYNGDDAPRITDLKSFNHVPLKGLDLKNIFSLKTSVKTKKEFSFVIKKGYSRKTKEILRQLNSILKESYSTAFIGIGHKEAVVAEIMLSRKEARNFTPGEKRIMHALRNIGESYYLNETFRETMLKFQREILYALVEILEIHDEDTKGHSEIVAKNSKAFAEYLGLEESVIEDIYWAAILHDIGKILVDRKILKKKEKLTLSEEEIIKKHPLYGYEALNQSKLTSQVAKYVLYHHERYDGEGYPYGLKGEEIPLGSRIIALANSGDIVESRYPFKKTKNREKIIKEITENLGTKYDPIIGKIFVEMVLGEKN